MKPIDFTETNVMFARDQSPYLPLPAYKSEDGEVITCWQLSFVERIKILFSGKMWLRVLTFNYPLQPQRPLVNNPWRK